MRPSRLLTVLLLTSIALAGCGDDDNDAVSSAGSSTTTTRSATTASTEPESTTSTAAGSTASTVAPKGGLAGEDAFVESLVGRTYAAANAKGVTAHQQSDFGQHGSWTLFTVEEDGHWYAFTTVNQKNDEGIGTLDDASKIAGGERLLDLGEDDWYGVSGVVRDGRPIGGVMMHGRGQERQDDGTFPVLDAWRVNLQTLKLEPSPTTGLDIVESCG